MVCFFVARKNKLPRPKPRLIEYCSMKNFDNAEFLTELKKKKPVMARRIVSRTWTISGVTGALSIRTFLTGMRRSRKNGCAVINYPGSHLKFNTNLPSAINRLFKRYRKNPTNNRWVAYKQQRNKVTSLKRKSIKEFCSNATSNAKHPGELWQKMKPLLPNSSLSKQKSVTLVEDGKVLTEPSEVVEVFNSYFASVALPEIHRGSVEDFSGLYL